jgi:hypothetical protein
MASNARNWKTGSAAWADFCKTEGAPLGLKGNGASWANFMRKHGPTLESCGIARRSPAYRTYIVDADQFGPAVFDLLTLGTLPAEFTTNENATAA